METSTAIKVLDDDDDAPPPGRRSTQAVPYWPYVQPHTAGSLDANRMYYDYNDRMNKWRTQPCLFYQKYGYCRKGDECNYSHNVPVTGKQFVSVDKLYRTKPCKYFFTEGYCRKGDNCNYSHDASVCTSPAHPQKFTDFSFD